MPSKSTPLQLVVIDFETTFSTHLFVCSYLVRKYPDDINILEVITTMLPNASVDLAKADIIMLIWPEPDITKKLIHILVDQVHYIRDRLAGHKALILLLTPKWQDFFFNDLGITHHASPSDFDALDEQLAYCREDLDAWRRAGAQSATLPRRSGLPPKKSSSAETPAQKPPGIGRK